jgi:hypothetical protein
MLACRQAGQWLLVVPRDGLRVLNRATGQDARYFGTWRVSARPATPSGGAIVDAESRTAINGLLAALESAGIIPPA